MGYLKLNFDQLKVLTLLILFSLIISLTALVIQRIPEKTQKIPTNNFVSIHISKSIAPFYCDGELEDCEKDIVIESSQGSGLAFYSEDGDTLILTASHLCESAMHDSNEIDSLRDAMIDIKIEVIAKDFYGNEWSAEIIDYNSESDLCLITSDMPISKNIKLAENKPHPGDKVYAISSPLSIRSDGAVPHFEGMFSGCDYLDICFYTVPATFGSSGSLILNSDYEVVGMIQMADPRFPSIAIGVSIVSIREFLQNSPKQSLF